jgi:hypothetical protein
LTPFLYIGESRAIKYCQEIFGFAISFGIVYDQYIWIILSIVVFSPVVLTGYFKILIIIEKFVRLHDDYFSAIGILFISGIPKATYKYDGVNLKQRAAFPAS